MNTSLGYSKKTLTNSNVLLSGGGDKALSEFIGSLNWDSTNKKLQYKSASSTNFTDLITFGSNAFTNDSYSLVGHKHPYTDLTGSGTTDNQAILSNGTTNGWKLVTLGSRAFDSNTYIRELDYYKFDSAENKAYRNYSGTGTEDYLKNLSMFAYDKAKNEIIGGRVQPNGLGIYLMRTYSYVDNNTGVPKYSGGLYLASSGCEAILFGYSNNNWFCNTIYHSGNLPAYPTKASWNYDDRYVSSLTTSGDYLRWVKNGSNNDITIPYATSAGAVAWANISSKPTATGGATTPVYWNGSGFTNCTAYGSASVNYANYSGYSNKVLGSYTSNGGKQNPDYFGKNRVGFLMMNTVVNGNSQYKDWVIMDCYNGSDVGGGVAIGVNRQSLGAYIMRSAAERTSWDESAELIGTHNYTTYTVKKDGTGATGTWGINITGNAANVTSVVAIANGGTGASTRLNALKNLTNENVSTNAQYFLTITTSWGKGGYTSVADAKTVLAMTGATSSANGTAGVVPAPPKDGYNTKFLRADGTWNVPAYPTKASWNYDDVYLKLSGGSITGKLSIKKDLEGNLADWVQKQHGGPLEVGRSTNSMCVAIGVTDDNYGYILVKGANITTPGNLVLLPGNGNLYKGSTNNIILDSSNSSVSKSGETLTVKINGTSQSLTNTWRPVLDSLTSTSASVCLSANQGRILNEKFANYVPKIAGTGSCVGHVESTNGWGGCKITIPGGGSYRYMMAFTVRIYSSYQYTDIVFSGYHFASNHWHAPAARVIGGTLNFLVVMGYVGDTANSLYVWFGYKTSNLGYGSCSVINVHSGHDNGPDWYSGWVIENVAYSNLTNKQLDTTTVLPSMEGHTHTWDSITGKPSTFTPSSHTHPFSQITDGTSSSTASGWSHILSNTYGGSLKSILYMCHGGGYGMHLRGYSTSSSVYMLQIYNSSTEVFGVYGDGHSNFGGNVGIGTTSPSYKLDVVGSARTKLMYFYNRANNANAGYIGAGSSSVDYIYFQAYTNNGLYMGANNGFDLVILPDHNVGVGTTEPSYKMHVNGNVGASNFYTTSDRSKKLNISSFSEHISKFQLKDTEKWHYGVIAQEVPEMFRDGKEGNMTVNYNSVLSYYVGCLENRVKELEDKLAKYEELKNK